jgi:LysM repeat protein
VIGRGETLSSISKQYGISIYAIAAANKHILDIDLVFKGQSINIPSATGDSQVVSNTIGSL